MSHLWDLLAAVGMSKYCVLCTQEDIAIPVCGAERYCGVSDICVRDEAIHCMLLV